MRLQQRNQKPDALSIVTAALLVLYVAGLLAPLVWSLLTSFTDFNDYYNFYVDRIFKNGPSFALTAENYQLARQYMNITATTTSITYNIIGMYILLSLGTEDLFPPHSTSIANRGLNR